MKKLNLVLITACSVCIMQACHSSSSSTGAATDSTTITTADKTTTDSSKQMAAPDTGDAAFAGKAAAGGMTEIALSKLAVQQSTNAKIKDFANMMITDHSAAGDKLAAIAKKEGINLPAGPDTLQQNMISDLSKKTGSDFNKAYVKQMVKDHKMTIDMFEKAQTTVKDTVLKSFITSTLPTLHKHMDAVNALKSGM